MYEIQAFLPGEDEPTDLDGLSAYLVATAAVGSLDQLPDYVLLDLDNGRDRTEIGSVG